MNRKVVLLFILYIFLAVALSEAAITTGTLAGVYAKNPPTLIIDDWDDGGSCNHAFSTQSFTSPNSLEINYNVLTSNSHSGEFNEDGMWRTRDVLGVQQGAVMLAIENYRTNNSIQNTFTDDDTPSGKITDLQASILDNQVVLKWTVPGNDGDTGDISDGIYEIRFSTDPADAWNAAPDNYLNYNIIWSTDVDPIPPSAITDLSASLDFQVKLTWTAPGDDGTTGAAAKYIIRYSSSANITTEFWWQQAKLYGEFSGPQSAGNTETKTLTGFAPDVNYWFAVRAVDDKGNMGNISNTTGNSTAAGYFALSQSLGGTAFAFGDMDNDVDMDLAVSGSYWTNIYRNDEGLLNSVQVVERGGSSVRWLDFDKDGFLDFVVIPGRPVSPTWDYQAHLYKNNSGTSFTCTQSFLRYDNAASGLDVADYDNDGDIDIALTGWGGGERTHIWRNDNGSFTNMYGCGFPQVQNSNVAFGDYNNDGWMDISLCGRIYKNDGDGTFSDSGYGGFRENPSLAWGDIDNDGDLDHAIGAGDPSHVLPNNGDGTFDEAILSHNDAGNIAAFGDYNNDGNIDLLFGNKLYTNMGGGEFWEKHAVSAGRRAAWGDIDNDGDLDFIDSSGLYKNMLTDYGVVNSTPSAPTGLSADVYGSSITFMWDDGSDTETPSDGLYYAMRVGTMPYNNPGDDNIIAGRFGTPLLGNHLRPKISNTQLGRYMKNLAEGNTYYWSVQTIDAGLRKSPWSEEQNVCIPKISPAPLNDLSATDAGDSHISVRAKLTWTATGDDGSIRDIIDGKYLIKYSSDSIDTWENMTYELEWSTNTSPGNNESKIISGLLSSTTYYFYIKLRDEINDNWSELSNKVTCYVEIILPAPITDLSAADISIGDQSILTWTATGNDGIAGDIVGGEYWVKYSSQSTDLWDDMPYEIKWPTNTSPGNNESRVITGLLSSTTYYFYIRLRDDVNNNWSGLSNKTTCEVLTDITSPAPTNNLSADRANTIEGQLRLSWTATGDNGNNDTLADGSKFAVLRSSYMVTWSTTNAQVIISTSNVNPGDNQIYVLTGLAPGSTYYCKLWTCDELQNWSSISNGATTWAQIDVTAPAAITNLTALVDGSLSAGEIKLQWSAPGDDIWDGTAASYEIRYASTTPPFFESFEDNNMDGWETGGGANWYVIKNGWIPAMFNNHYANSGEYSAWCEYNGTDNWSWIKRTVTGPYTFSFWWKTYKPNTSKFKVDGVDIISPGRVNGWDWEKQTYELSPGTHTVEWSFKLDNGFISIDDIDIRGNIWKSSRPVGGPAGFNEIETITGLTQGATYYFRIWTADEALNWSGLSNGATEQAKE